MIADLQMLTFLEFYVGSLILCVCLLGMLPIIIKYQCSKRQKLICGIFSKKLTIHFIIRETETQRLSTYVKSWVKYFCKLIKPMTFTLSASHSLKTQYNTQIKLIVICYSPFQL